MNGFYEQVAEILKANGWHYDRAGKGSHRIWKKEGVNHSVIVPYNCKSRFTANAVLQQAGCGERIR